MPSCTSRLELLGRALGGVLLPFLITLLASLAPAQAAENQIRSAEILSTEEGYVVNADIDLTLNNRLEDALRRGVSLYFLLECELSRPRWYWFDEQVVNQTLTYRLSYQAITRAYRLSIGSLHQNFDSMEAAFRTMLRIRNWGVAERGELRTGLSYNVALRLGLDTTQLPKPFQVTTIGSRDWNLSTDWLRWTFLATPAEAR
jgi:uncharacterized protein DUF4390